MANGTVDTTSPAHRPPAFGAHERAAPTSVATTVASALAASAFHFEARAAQGEWPLPLMGDAACDVISRMLCHAAATSANLVRRHHVMTLLPHEIERVEAALPEILAAKFPMPVEGGTHSVPMLRTGEVRDGQLWFSLDDTYAAHARAAGALGAAGAWSQASSESASLESANESIAIDDEERQMLVAGLQLVVQQRTAGWNFHAIERLAKGQVPEAPTAFGIPQALTMLRKLGASAGGYGL